MFVLSHQPTNEKSELIYSLIPGIKIYTLVYANGHPQGDGEALSCALERWGRWDTFTTAVSLNLVIWIMDILLVRQKLEPSSL